MDIIEPINPPAPACTASLKRVVVAVEAADCPSRARIILNEEFLGQRPAQSEASRAQVAAPTPQPLTYLGLLERIIGGWAPTLRAALLLTMMLLGLTALAVVGLGFEGAVVIIAIGTAMQFMQRRLARPAGP